MKMQMPILKTTETFPNKLKELIGKMGYKDEQTFNIDETC